MPNTVVDPKTSKADEWLHVVAAVIYNAAGQILLAQRSSHQHQGGKWEFPGGKVEPGETARHALRRELQEELGIDCVPEVMQPFIDVYHRYPDKPIFLDVWTVGQYSGEARGVEGQIVTWFELDALQELDFPAANRPILQQLFSES